MDKISMIYNGSNKNKNNSSYYDKDEEIKIHFLDEEKSIKNNQKNESRNVGIKNKNESEIRNNKTFTYGSNNKNNNK